MMKKMAGVLCIGMLLAATAVSAQGLPAENAKKAAEFLEANKKKQGVVALPSGLQYRMLKQGSGRKPKATDVVTVHYEGRLINGKVFDSSIKRGQPATFPLNQVIKGWTEGVQLLNEGGKIELYIPPDMGYGMRGAGPDIGPNELLIFTVELLSIGK